MGSLGQIEGYKKHIPKDNECCWVWEYYHIIENGKYKGERKHYETECNEVIPIAKPGCNEMEFEIREDFEPDICPYCGKKIKVVEE